MTAVVVAYRADADYFAGFLVELLRSHRVDVRASPGAGTVPADAFASCDALVVLVPRGTAAPPGVLPEVAAFEAAGTGRPVVALLLGPDAEASLAGWGLADAVRLRCCDSLLESLRALLRLLGRRLFAAGELPPHRREPGPERRASETYRRASADRRQSPVEQRLRVGMYKYLRSGGRDLLEPVRRMTRAGDLARCLAAEDSPLRSFDFTDRRTGEQVTLSYPMIEEIVLASWRARRGTEQAGAAYVVDDTVTALAQAYVVTSRDRRTVARRGGRRTAGAS